ncbi:MAG: hypothetical protein JNK10_08010 [Cyclobacteriaceae bacterium]|nr:hypothetical protein [Cyclobacteriaceae bacterium]
MGMRLCGLIFLISVSLLASAQVQKPLSGSPASGSPSLPADLGFLANSVNQFTGQVQFTMPLMSISGKAGLSYSVNAGYSSMVSEVVDVWNREAPTGVLGLGWTLDIPRIVADHKGTVDRNDDSFFIVGGGVNSMLLYDGLEGTDWKYYMEKYEFWKIRYNPTNDKWTVIKEDGTKFTFGGNAARKSTQYMVGFGNWIGNASHLSGGAQLAYVWDLDEVVDIWGDNLTFTYIQDVEAFGGTVHTRASYLSKITNSIGEYIHLVYQLKQQSGGIVEFQDPHTEGNESDGYQEKYEDKYLDRIVRFNESGQVLGELRLGYQILKSGELAKRLLQSMAVVSGIGSKLPPMTFGYETVDEVDRNFGALLQVTLPSGGYMKYDYDPQELTGTSLEDSIAEVTGYREPKVWFGDDYTVVTRRKMGSGTTHTTSAQPVIVDVLTWEGGKWKQQSMGASYASTGTMTEVTGRDVTESNTSDHINDQDFQLVTCRNLFATLHRLGSSDVYHLFLYRKKEGVEAEWIQHQVVMNRGNGPNYPYQNLGDRPRLMAGTDFVAIGAENGNHFAIRWNGSAWDIQTVNKPAGKYIYGAANNYIITTRVDSNPDVTTVYYLNKSLTWNEAATSISTDFSDKNLTGDGWFASNSFACVVGTKYQFSIFLNPNWHRYQQSFYTLNWGPGFSGFTLGPEVTLDENVVSYATQQPVLEVKSLNSYVIINGSMATVIMSNSLLDINFSGLVYGTSKGGISYRYTGTSWVSSGLVDYFPADVRSLFSFGEDFRITPRILSSMAKKTVLRQFNPNNNTWLAETVFDRTIHPISIMAGANWFVTNGRFYYRGTNGVFNPYQRNEQAYSPEFLVDGPIQSIHPLQAGFNFITASYPDGTQSGVVSIKNGGIHLPYSGQSETNLPPSSGEGRVPELISDVYSSLVNPEFLPSPQVSSNTIVTFQVTDASQMQVAKSLKIYRVVSEKVMGALKQFVARSVENHNGIASVYTSFAFESPTTDVTGLIPQFNKFTTIPGSANPSSRPNGYVVSHSFNGPLQPTYVGDANSNVSVYNYMRVLGAPYLVETFNASNTKVSETSSGYLILPKALGFYYKPVVSVSKQDGLEIRSTQTFDVNTGMPKVNLVTSISGGSPYQSVQNETIYWWEAYDHTRTKWIFTGAIYQRKLVDGIPTDATATKYKLWGVGNVPAPWKSYQWRRTGPSLFTPWTETEPSSDWKQASAINSYDSRGLVTSTTDKGFFTSVVFDPVRPLVVAEISNADLTHVQHFNFENAVSNTSADAYMGMKSSTASLTVTPSLSPSKLTYWTKPVSGGNWQLTEQTISSQITIGGTVLGVAMLIDEVRVHPPLSSMKTMAYNIFGNVTAASDQNNRTVFYEFDEFAQPKFVRDQNKNIIQHTFTNIKN